MSERTPLRTNLNSIQSPGLLSPGGACEHRWQVSVVEAKNLPQSLTRVSVQLQAEHGRTESCDFTYEENPLYNFQANFGDASGFDDVVHISIEQKTHTQQAEKDAVLVGEAYIPLGKYKNKWGRVLKTWLPLQRNGANVKPQIFVELKHKYQGGDDKPKCCDCWCC